MESTGQGDALPGATCWILTDGKAGDAVQCIGLAERLGTRVDHRVVTPRPPWSWLTPYGPIDPREAPDQPVGPLSGPLPDIAIASGRRAVPYLRAVKRASGGKTFTVFLKDPYVGSTAADVIWVPEHDRLRGPNVIVTLTSPNRLTPEGLAAARAQPDSRLAGLASPRVGLILGGPSAHYRFTARDTERIVAIARSLLSGQGSLMVTPSRRTPTRLVDALLSCSAQARDAGRCFVWDRGGSNPYGAMLALADALVITGDSVNMLGEAAMTGAPIHVVETSGGHPKMTRFIDRLVDYGAARRWTGRLEQFSYAPLDATPVIAREVAARYAAFRAGRS